MPPVAADNPPPPQLRKRYKGQTIEEVERQVKSSVKVWLFSFYVPAGSFCRSFQIRLLEYFSQKQKEQRHKQLGYTDKMVTTET
jgi:hypothetical protein